MIRSLLAPWIGGGSLPPTAVAPRGLLAFWMGGAVIGQASQPDEDVAGGGLVGGLIEPRRLPIQRQRARLFEPFDGRAGRVDGDQDEDQSSDASPVTPATAAELATLLPSPPVARQAEIAARVVAAAGLSTTGVADEEAILLMAMFEMLDD